MNIQRIRIEKFESISYIKDKKGRILIFESRHASCFIITLKGRIKFSFADKVIITDHNHGIFIPEGTAYRNECLENAESLCINFRLTDADVSPCALNGINEKMAMSLYHEMLQKSYEVTQGVHYFLLSKLYQLAYLLMYTEPPKSDKELLAEKACVYIQSEFTRADLRIDEVAACCSVSAVYLRKIMKELYRKTPFQLLTERRMMRAQEMLLEKRPIKEIALSVGYADIYQFSRAYKRYFGYAPTTVFV